jgi:hypothetical protein
VEQHLGPQPQGAVPALDGEEVLLRLRSVPVTTWNYLTQDRTIRHIGPMAQDFHAAFGLGESELLINTVDIDGVNMAADPGARRADRSPAGDHRGAAARDHRADFNLGEGEYASLAEAQAAGAPTINYGLFFNAIISFLIVAFAVFLLVQSYNRLREQQESVPVAPTTQDCPFCRFSIPVGASRCAHCTSQLQQAAAPGA